MIVEYLTRRDAENYARELAPHYGPDVHFDVVSLPDPVFGDTVWYVLGTGTVDGRDFAQYAQERQQWRNASATIRAQPRAGARDSGQRGELC
jgi:hypothetical protein